MSSILALRSSGFENFQTASKPGKSNQSGTVRHPCNTINFYPHTNVEKQWTTDNDGEELVPKVYKSRSDMSYMKTNFEFIDNREKLAKMLPIIMKMKEIAFLFEPSYPPGKSP